MSDPHINELTTLEEVAALRDLVREYLDYVTGQAKEHFGIVVDAATFTEKTMSAQEKFLAPHGRSFVAEVDGALLGMILLRPCGEKAVEIKRLFVRPDGRGMRLGARLVDHVIAAARDMGKRHVFLDSTKNLKDAARLYEKRGFKYTEPYPESDHYNDHDLVPHMIFMRLDL